MNPLAELKDIHLPQAIPSWPPAYGWWILAVLLLATLILSIWLIRRYRQRRVAKRQALLALQSISAEGNYPEQLNQLLKRAALSYFPREQIAMLHGDAWLKWLLAQVKPAKQAALQQQLQPIMACLYQADAEAPAFAPSQQACRSWLQQALPPKNSMPAGVAPAGEPNHV